MTTQNNLDDLETIIGFELSDKAKAAIEQMIVGAVSHAIEGMSLTLNAAYDRIGREVITARMQDEP